MLNLSNLYKMLDKLKHFYLYRKHLRLYTLLIMICEREYVKNCYTRAGFRSLPFALKTTPASVPPLLTVAITNNYQNS